MAQRMRREGITSLQKDLESPSIQRRQAAAQRIHDIGISNPAGSGIRQEAANALFKAYASETDARTRTRMGLMIRNLGFNLSVVPRRERIAGERIVTHDELRMSGPLAEVRPRKTHPENKKEPETATRKRESALEEIAKGALAIAALPLIIVGYISGCGPAGEVAQPRKDERAELAPPEATPVERAQDGGAHEEAPRNEELLWWPAYILKDGKLTDVSVGFVSDKAPFPAESMYGWADGGPRIPPESWEAGREGTESWLSIAGMVFRKEEYERITGDMLFSAGVHGFKVVGEGQDEVACFDGCPEYTQTISYLTSGPGVLIHEFLHDAWGDLSQEQIDGFVADSQSFFNAASQDWRGDQVLRAITSGTYRINPEDKEEVSYLEGFDKDDPFNAESVFTPIQYSDRHLQEWAEDRLQHLSPSERERAIKAMQSYLAMMSHIVGNHTVGMSQEGRADWLVFEGWPRMGADFGPFESLYTGKPTDQESVMPRFMAVHYHPVMEATVIDSTSNTGQGHFESREEFDSFIPLAKDFVDYMENRFPELARIRNP